jgi:hypothetical protein
MWKIASLFCGVLFVACAAQPVKAQPVYLMDFPESRESVEYAIWIINERVGFTARFAGDHAQHACEPGITIRRASAEEWTAAKIPFRTRAVATRCPNAGAYHVVLRPGEAPTRALILHEMAHTFGCWRHHQVSFAESWTGSRHVMAPSTQDWAGLTAEDIDCIAEGAFWTTYDNPDYCFVELLPNFDLIAPDALGNYYRMEFVGDIEAGKYLWRVAGTAKGGKGCASVRAVAGAVELLDVRGMQWEGSATLAPEGNLWRLVRVKAQ